MSDLNKQEFLQQIDDVLNAIRPHLQADGGDIEVVDVTDDNTVHVRLLGACESCSMSFMTMKAGVERSIIKAFPEIVAVKTVNPHLSSSF